MADQPTQYQQVYGFARSERHFIWRNPEDVQPPAPSDVPNDQAMAAEVPSEAPEVAACPPIPEEIPRIIEAPPASTPDACEALTVAPASEPPQRRKKSPRRAKTSESRPVDAPRDSRLLTPLELHRSQCSICGSEFQLEIDQRFIDWEFVNRIVDDYTINRSTLYRHAHATGLFARRDRNIRGALSQIIQKACKVEPTADSIVRAVKTFTHINSRGQWVNPPTEIVVSASVRRRSPDGSPKLLESGGTQQHLLPEANS